MKSRLFNALVIGSLAILGILFMGYFCNCGPGIVIANGPPRMQKQIWLRVDRGRVEVDYNSAVLRTSTAGISLTWSGSLIPHHLPDLRRSGWEFDAHWLALSPTTSFYLFAFPIWCAALPFLIAPGIWLYQRRRREPLRGFSVESTAVPT